MNDPKAVKQGVLVGAVIILAAVVAIVVIANNSSTDSNQRPSKQGKLSTPLTLDDAAKRAKERGLQQFFSLYSPDTDYQVRAYLSSAPYQLQLGYFDPQGKDSFRKGKAEVTAFVVTELAKSDLNIAQLVKTSSAEVNIPGAKVYLPPQALLKKGQLFALSADGKVAGLVSSAFHTKTDLVALAKQLRLARS